MPVFTNDKVAAAATLVDLLGEHAAVNASRMALTFTGGPGAPEGCYTYAELHERAQGIAASLQRHCAPSDRALLLFPSGLDYVLGLLGCLYARVIAVPVNLPGPSRVARVLPRIAGIIGDCEPAAVLTTGEILSGAGETLPGGLRALCVDGPLADAADWRRPDLRADDIAFLQYTSGSTGAPKGVINRHDGLIANAVFLTCLTRPHDASVTVSWLPLFHDMGLIMGVLNPLLYGAQAVLMPPGAFTRDPLSWLGAATRHRATVLPGPAFAFQAMADAASASPGRLARLDLASVEAAVPAAEPVLPSTVEHFIRSFASVGLRREAVKPSYGLAETTLIASGSAADKGPVIAYFDKASLEQGRIVRRQGADEQARGYVANGADFGGQDLRIVDPETRRPCDSDAVGEIWVSGPAVASGYWQQPEATRETFAARLAVAEDDPAARRDYVRTGDLGAIVDGELFITGRLKDAMIFRGRCHYPSDVEATVAAVDERLVAHGGAAFTVERDGLEHLVIVQEAERRTGQADADWDWLLTLIRRAVGQEHDIALHAAVLVRKGTLLKTTSGKIRRAEMRRAYLAGELTVLAARTFETRSDVATVPAAPDAAPLKSEDIRARVLSLLGSALGGVSPHAIDPDTGFFDLGLDSIAAVELAGALERIFGTALPDGLLFANPNVDALVEHLAGRKPSAIPGGDAATASPIAASEPIAVIGIGCLFPGEDGRNAESPQAFWDFLNDGHSAIRRAPKDRYDIDLDIPGFGSFLADVGRFDAGFFGISPREAISTDPQQRLLLEVAWHALEDAGIGPRRLRGSDAGVFVGIGTNDYGHIPFLSGDPADFDAYYGTGNSTAAASGRLSYFFGLEGPSLSVDTACSSSLVSVHLAMQSLRLGECGLALAGGVKLHLVPEIDLALTKAGMLARDGQCKTFDATADGYVRGEGCALLVLKRLSDARRDGDRIRGVIRQTTVRQDGVRSGLTVPDGNAQRALIARTLREAGLSPADIDYVEAHGTGTRIGDPIEYGALLEVFGPRRDSRHPLWIGSVKTNIGHLEAAAGIAGLVKALLALERKTLPPHINFSTCNPAIDLEALPARIPTALTPWPREEGIRRAGVTSFGFTGTIAHAVLEEAPHSAAIADAPGAGTDDDAPSHLLALSAHSPAALAAISLGYRDLLRDASVLMRPLANAAHRHRDHLALRRAIVAGSRAELIEALAVPVPETMPVRQTPKVAFLFTGQGAQYAGMAGELFASEPLFRAALKEADAALRPHMRRSAIEVMFAEGDAALHETEYTQPALFALGYALARMWTGFGVTPGFIAGHSIGECAAAVIAGALPLAEAARLVALRGRLMQSLPKGGAMAALRLSREEAERAIAPLCDRLGIAAVNGPRDIVLSGEAEALETVLARSEAAGISVRRLTVSHAFHSPLMAPILRPLADEIGTLGGRAPDMPFYSTSAGAFIEDGRLGSPDYWREHAANPVLFADAVAAAAAQGCTSILEIGPSGVLTAMARRVLDEARPGHSIVLTPSLRPGTHDVTGVRHAVAALYEAGQDFDWPRIARGPALTPDRLPLYPFDRQHYWFDVQRNAQGVSRRAKGAESGRLDVYALEWQEIAAPDAVPATRADWLLIADKGGIAETLAAALRGHGHAVRICDMADGLDALGPVAAGCHVVFLRGLDLRDEAIDDDGPLLDLVALAQHLKREGAAIAALMVPGIGVNGAAEASGETAQAALWGAGRSLAFEAPNLRLRLLDLDPLTTVAGQLQRACDLSPVLKPEHDMLMLRGERLLSPRLTPKACPDTPAPTMLRADGVYVIAGGAGALGRHMTEWLARRGVKHILWLGRGEPQSRARTLIAALAGRGVTVRFERADIEDRGDLERIFAGLDAEDIPLRGVLHCAGTGRFNTLEQLTTQDFRAVTRGKMAGSWHLHDLTRGCDLDLFWLFSSISGIWGSRLQIPYGAANAFQDALARKRRAAGLPALAIAWGPWGGGAGMSELGEDLLDYLRRAGIHRREPEICLASLDPLLALSAAEGRADYVCADIDWADFLPLYETVAGTPLFERCGTAQDRQGRKALGEAASMDEAKRILALPPAERPAAVLDFIIGVIARILRIEPHRLAQERDLIVLGLDSIMVMDFARQVDQAFGIACALRQIFETPTAAQLATYVCGLIEERLATGAEAPTHAAPLRLVHDAASKYEPFPLTELQHAYWAGRSGAFSMGNIACHAYLETETGLTDIGLIEASWNALVARHDAMRLVIDGDGRQRILAEVPRYAIAVADLGAASPEAVEAHIAAWRAELSHQVLPTDRWPLFDVRATRLPDGRTRLHFSIDMLINDATSSQILWDELSLLCASGGDIAAAGLQPFAVSFRDYVVAKFDRDAARQAEYDEARRYWLAKLDTLPPAPDLPLAVDPEHLHSPAFTRYSAGIDAARWSAMKQRAASLGLTPASLLISAFADALAAWSAAPAFTINLTIFDRRPWHEDVARMVGDFTSVTLLGIERARPASFAENALALHRGMIEDLQHRAFSAVDVMREMNAARQGPRHLMPVVFTSQFGVAEPSKADGSGGPLGKVTCAITQTPQVWIDQQVCEQDGALVFNWDVVEALFPSGMMAAMFGAYRGLLERLASDDESWHRPVGALLPASQAEIRRAVNDTAAAVPDGLLHEPFFARAAEQPDALALVAADGRQWRYSELAAWSRGIAGALAGHTALSGAEVGRVAVLMEKGPEQIAAVLGILAAGGVYVPIDPAWPDARIATILDGGDVRAILAQPWRYGELTRRFGESGLQILDVAEAGLGRVAAMPIGTVHVAPGDPAYVIYTSGSTGTPKGVVIDHRGALNTVVDVNDRFGVGADDRVFGLSALSFDLSVYDIFGTFHAGGALILPDEDGRRDPSQWARLCGEHGVTVWNSVPALMDMMLAENKPAALGALRNVFLSGDWVPLGLPERLSRQVPGARLVCMGGATEASIWSNWFVVDAVAPDWKSVPYGYPLNNQGYRVLDGHLADRPDWVPGDLYISGIGLAHGYDGDAEKTAASFITHPGDGGRLYRTGDLARYRADGVIEFLGRSDTQVKVGGHRIELGEIEAALGAHPAVREAVADAVGDDGEIKRLIAWIVPDTAGLDAEPVILPALSCDPVRAEAAHADAVRAIQQAMREDMPRAEPEAHEAFWRLMEDIAAQCVRDGFTELCLFADGSPVSEDAFRQRIGADERFRGVVESWLALLVAKGEVRRTAEGLVAPSGLAPADWDALIARARAVGLPADPLARLRRGAGDRLRVIRGEESAIGLFYGADDALSPEHLSRHNPLHRGAILGMRRTLENMLAARSPENPLRVLEIGARTGLATRDLLAGLDTAALRYTVSDTSRAFLDSARQTLASLPDAARDGLTYTVFDPDQDRQSQGLDAHDFDLIVAFNALHRSRDLPRLAQNLAGLLAPGGLLLAPEITRNSGIQAVTVALLEEGYTHLRDARRETRLPLLRARDWESAFAASGGWLTARAVVPDPRWGEHYGLHVIAACRHPVARRLDVDALQAYLRQRVPGYMVPHQVVMLDGLPLSANGKVDRKALPKPAIVAKARRTAEAAQTAEEIALAALWQALLGVGSVGRGDSFFDLGGDSLIAVRLVERVRGTLNRALMVRDVFEAPTLQGLALRVAGAAPCDAGGLPVLRPAPEDRHAPFPLTDVQQAYWIGRQLIGGLGGVSTYLYTEIDVEGLSPARLEAAWNRLIARHEMLRAVVDDDGMQRILPEVSHYTVMTRELAQASEAEIEAAHRDWREAMSHQVLPSAEWPLFDIRALSLPGGTVRLLVGIDNIICDGRSMQLLLREWSAIARGGTDDGGAQADALAPLEASFRDYVLAEDAFADSPERRRSLTYWLTRMPELPAAPALPVLADPSALMTPRFVRWEGTLEPETWQRFRQIGADRGVTANAALLAAYAAALGHWSASPDFTLNLTLFNRLALHADIDALVGDFTSLVLLACQEMPRESFTAAARHLHAQLGRDLDHVQLSAVRAVREFTRSRGLPTAPAFPVVFTSGLGVDAEAARTPPLGRFGWGITQTPQVWIDHQVVERGGALAYNWDAVAELFPAGLMDAMCAAHAAMLGRLADDPSAWELPLAELLPAYGHAAFAPAPQQEPRRAPADAATSVVSVAAIAELSRTIAGLIREEAALPQDPELRNRTFFELGMTSLTLIRLRQKLQDRTGIVFPTVDLFAHPTIAGLARRLAQRRHGEARPVTRPIAAQGGHQDMRLSRRDRRLALRRDAAQLTETAE